MPVIIIAVIILIVLYWKSPFLMKVAIFIVNLFIPDPILFADEVLMLLMIFGDLKKIADNIKMGMTVKQAIDFVNGKKKK